MTSNIIGLFALLHLSATASAQTVLDNRNGKDLTLSPGSSGVDVVDAAILKINSVSGVGNFLKNDFGFLKRIALVESNFGQSISQSVTNRQRGIWQITPTIVDILNSNAAIISNLVNIFESAFGSAVVDFQNNNFSVPLKSAVAARLFIEIQLSNQAIPGSVSEQASWWNNKYQLQSSNNRVNFFIQTVENYEKLYKCTVSTLDIWFLIDGSGSIGETNFRECLNFVDKTAKAFEISSENVRTGLMIYSSDTTLRSNLNEHQSNELFSSVVSSTPYSGGGTLTGYAIRTIFTQGFNESSGARPKNQQVPRVLVVLTDGQSGDNVTSPALEIQNSGVTVFGVGVGAGYNQAEIDAIASDPDNEFAYEISEFSTLGTVLQDRVTKQACKAVSNVPSNTSVSLLVKPNSTVYSQIDLPSQGSVELRYEVNDTTGTGTVYLSERAKNPNSAYHDATFEVNVRLTSVFYNANDGTSANNQRKKRQAENGQTKPLYIAFENKGSKPTKLKFTATTSATRASSSTKPDSGATVVKGMAAYSILFLAFFSFLLS